MDGIVRTKMAFSVRYADDFGSNGLVGQAVESWSHMSLNVNDIFIHSRTLFSSVLSMHISCLDGQRGSELCDRLSNFLISLWR